MLNTNKRDRFYAQINIYWQISSNNWIINVQKWTLQAENNFFFFYQKEKHFEGCNLISDVI